MITSTCWIPSGNSISSILPLTTRITSRGTLFNIQECLCASSHLCHSDWPEWFSWHTRWHWISPPRDQLKNVSISSKNEEPTAMTILAPALAANKLKIPTPQPMSSTTLSLNRCRLLIIALRNVFVRISSFNNSWNHSHRSRVCRMPGSVSPVYLVNGKMSGRIEIVFFRCHIFRSHFVQINGTILSKKNNEAPASSLTYCCLGIHRCFPWFETGHFFPRWFRRVTHAEDEEERSKTQTMLVQCRESKGTNLFVYALSNRKYFQCDSLSRLCL